MFTNTLIAKFNGAVSIAIILVILLITVLATLRLRLLIVSTAVDCPRCASSFSPQG